MSTQMFFNRWNSLWKMGEEDIAVSKFREYLRVNTDQPNPDYEACKDFLFGLADELNISRRAVYMVEKIMIVIMTIPGTKPELPSLALYSHTDVVPTFKDFWTHDPYSAFKDEDGNIFARGAQDMKCVGSQYVEAIRRHFLRGKKQWERTIHIIWGPEEETGGVLGMKAFAPTEEFDKLNIGFVLDEGVASPDEHFHVFYAERCPWWVKVTFEGSPGHAMNFIENTAMEKLQSFVNQALEFRDEEKKRKEENNLTLGEVTTLNITIIEGGVQPNVLPEKYSLIMDMRVTPLQDFDEIEGRIKKWCENAGTGVHFEFLQKTMFKNITPNTMDDPWWATFEGALTQEGCTFKKSIFYGATDSRFVRAKGIRSIGFSPMNHTPMLLHDHNEFLNEKVFLRGVEIYETLIDKLADLKDV